MDPKPQNYTNWLCARLLGTGLVIPSQVCKILTQDKKMYGIIYQLYPMIGSYSINIGGKTDKGGFHLVALVIRELKSHMICQNSSPIIGWNYSIQTGDQISTNESTWIYKRSGDF